MGIVLKTHGFDYNLMRSWKVFNDTKSKGDCLRRGGGGVQYNPP
jgi:hypothetical protein